MAYCGNCGKEIAGNEMFCPECGTPINATNHAAVKKSHKFSKKTIGILASIALLFAAVVIGVKVYSYISSIPSETDIRTTANNQQNGGVVTSDGKWLYYNDQGLCKVKLDDSSKQQVISNEIMPEKMFYLGNSLYYYTFPGYYRLTEDGTGEDLGFSIFTQDCIQFDGKSFYVTGMGNYDDGGIYSVNANDIDKAEKISDVHPTELLLNGDYLYVISGYTSIDDMPNENYGVWRIDKDGKNPIYLLDYCPAYIVFSANSIFYTNRDHQLCTMSFDGSDEQVFEDVYVGSGLNVTESHIFFIDRETENIYRMNVDGTGKTVLNTARSDGIHIAGDWLFYTNEDFDYEIYQMSFDGSYNQPIY